MIFLSEADEKLVVACAVPAASTLAICTPMIPTCWTGGTVGSQVAAGVGLPGTLVIPPMVTEGSEPVSTPVPVEESGATVALADVDPGLGDDPGVDPALAPLVVVGWASGLVAEVPEVAAGVAAAVAPGAGLEPAGAVEVPDPPADGEPATEPAFWDPPVHAVSETARTRREACTHVVRVGLRTSSV